MSCGWGQHMAYGPHTGFSLISCLGALPVSYVLSLKRKSTLFCCWHSSLAYVVPFCYILLILVYMTASWKPLNLICSLCSHTAFALCMQTIQPIPKGSFKSSWNPAICTGNVPLFSSKIEGKEIKFLFFSHADHEQNTPLKRSVLQ